VQAFIPRSWGLDRGPWQDRYRTRSDSCWDEQRDLKGMRLIFFSRGKACMWLYHNACRVCWSCWFMTIVMYDLLIIHILYM